MLPLSPEHGAHRPSVRIVRRKPSRMTAPAGECPYCDARREYNREQVEKYRPKKRRVRQ